MRLLLSVTLLVALVPATAGAVSVNDIVALSKAGVSEQVIVALIEQDQTNFRLDSDQLLALKSEGVSDAVLIAMMRSGRQEAAVPTTAPVQVGPVENPRGSGAVPGPVAITLVIPYAVPYVVVNPTVSSRPRHNRPVTSPPPGNEKGIFFTDGGAARGIFFTGGQSARGIFFDEPSTAPQR